MPSYQACLFFCVSLGVCSTLDPVLRKEVTGPNWQTFALLGTASIYFLATPGGWLLTEGRERDWWNVVES